MGNSDDIRVKVDRMAAIRREQEHLKAEWARLEAFILQLCNQDLKDTKLKSVEYSGTGGKLIATMAETLKVNYPPT